MTPSGESRAIPAPEGAAAALERRLGRLVALANRHARPRVPRTPAR
jgi:hypothetical protein